MIIHELRKLPRKLYTALGECLSREGLVPSKEVNRTKVFKIKKRMCADDRDFIGKNCVKNDKEDLTLTDHEKLLAWQEHYERLLNEEFRCIID